MIEATTVNQLVQALRELREPTVAQKRFLAAHHSAPGRTSTATKLARAAGYKNFSALNLQYGVLARRIGERLGQEANLSFLVEFTRPNGVTNDHWLLHMRPEVATALERAGWV